MMQRNLGRLGKAFDEAAFAAAVGQVTGPVRSTYGYHLIQVYRHQDEVMRPFQDVKAEIGERLQRQAAQKTLRARMEELRGKLSGESLDPAVLGAEWPVSEPPAFALGAPEIDATIGTDVFTVSRPVFDSLTLPTGKLSRVLEGGRNFYLVELMEVQPSRPLTLAEARAEARGMLVDERAARTAKEAAFTP